MDGFLDVCAEVDMDVWVGACMRWALDLVSLFFRLFFLLYLC